MDKLMSNSDSWPCGKCGALNIGDIFESDCSFCKSAMDGPNIKNIHVKVLSCGHTKSKEVAHDTFRQVSMSALVLLKKASKYTRAIYTNNTKDKEECLKCSSLS